MRFLHCADLHIGRSRDFPKYLERQAAMLDGIFDVAQKQTDGLVVIAGDIYDAPVLRPREKDLFIDKLSHADKDGITTVIINGNHDIIDQMDGGYTHLRTIKDLIASKRLKNTIFIEFNPEALYLEKFKLGFIGVPALYRKSQEVNDTVYAFTQSLREQYGNIPVVACVHEAIAGAMDETGFSFPKGLRLDGTIPVTYWALGDIHGCQKIPGVPNAWYSGCPIQHDFKDSGRRGVLVVDTDVPHEPTFVPLYHKVQKLVTVVFGKDQDNSEVEIPLDSIVRVEATKKQLSEIYLPPNVVRTKVVNNIEQPAPIKPVGLDDLFDGLVEILADMGTDQEGQEFCLDLTRKLQ